VLLEKDGGQLGRSCERKRSVTYSERREEYHTYSKQKKANWIGHSWRRNCLLEHVVEGEMEGKA
jgi:hypothetical protein